MGEAGYISITDHLFSKTDMSWYLHIACGFIQMKKYFWYVLLFTHEGLTLLLPYIPVQDNSQISRASSKR